MTDWMQASQFLYLWWTLALLTLDIGWMFSDVASMVLYPLLALLQVYLCYMSAQPSITKFFRGEKAAQDLEDFQKRMKKRCKFCARPQVRVVLFYLCWTMWLGRAADMKKAPAWCPDNTHWGWPVCLGFM